MGKKQGNSYPESNGPPWPKRWLVIRDWMYGHFVQPRFDLAPWNAAYYGKGSLSRSGLFLTVKLERSIHPTKRPSNQTTKQPNCELARPS